MAEEEKKEGNKYALVRPEDVFRFEEIVLVVTLFRLFKDGLRKCDFKIVLDFVHDLYTTRLEQLTAGEGTK